MSAPEKNDRGQPASLKTKPEVVKKMIPYRRVGKYLVAAFVVLVTAAPLVAGEKKILEKLDDLPRHTYSVEGKAVDFIRDEAKVLALATEVRRDVEADLAEWEIDDKTTLKGFHSILGTIAFLQGRYDDYLAELDSARALEEKESSRLMSGLVGASWVAALRSGGGDTLDVFRREFEERVNALPYETVEAQVKRSKGMMELLTENLLLGGIESTLQPLVDDTGGKVSRDVASRLIGAFYTLRDILPLRDAIAAVYAAYLDAHHVEKENIWTARNVDFDGSEGYPNVTVAIWDSGVDVECYPDRLWRNGKEVPENDIDDDGNGFVDDVNGIAWTLHSDRTTGVLYPIGDVGGDRDLLERRMKGLDDITSGIDSEEAGELKRKIAALPKDDVKSFIEGISKYGSYAHGTHVAGIASAGNPYIRLMAARLTFDYRMIGETPTVEQARKDSLMFLDTVRYFRRNGVRLVNMSWGGSLGSVESDLETHGVGDTPEERKALARKIFEIGRNGLKQAMEEAP